MGARLSYAGFGKRFVDIAVSAVALIALAPVFLIAAVLVKCTSSGPVFYRARRAGLGGREIRMLKFRTMYTGAQRQGAITARDDQRIFPAGRILRLLKIDELPQLWNVLKGELSLVGPRPEDLEIVEECYTPRQREVLHVKPGLTGIPQVVFYPEFPQFSDRLSPEEHYRKRILPMRLELDREYMRRQSFRLDFWLLLMTLLVILHQAGRQIRLRAAQPPARADLEEA